MAEVSEIRTGHVLNTFLIPLSLWIVQEGSGDFPR